MASLDGEDGTGSSQVVRIHDRGGCSEISIQASLASRFSKCDEFNVRRDTDTLKDRGKGHKILDRCEAKLVLQLIRWSISSCDEGTRDEIDVGPLVKIDLLEVLIEWVGKSSLCEILFRELGQSLLIELPFQELQGESVVENDAIVNDGRGDHCGIMMWGGNAESNREGGGNRCGEFHGCCWKTEKMENLIKKDSERY